MVKRSELRHPNTEMIATAKSVFRELSLEEKLEFLADLCFDDFEDIFREASKAIARKNYLEAEEG